MLFWFSPRRLALLATCLFIVAIITSRRTTYNQYLPKTYLPGPFKGQSDAAANAVVNNPNIPATQVFSGTRPSSLPHYTDDQINSKIHQLRTQWSPPSFSDHWPPYDKYGDADYDPNLWESFDWDHGFYVRNGIKRLNKEKPHAAKLAPYLPYPDYNSAEWKQAWHGRYVSCEGPRGKPLNESVDDWLIAYSAIPDGFPQPAVGDSGVLGIDADRCFDRHHRLGPYGYGQNSKHQIHDWIKPRVSVDWTKVPWGRLQDQCMLSNSDRYMLSARQPVELNHRIVPANATTAVFHKEHVPQDPKYHHRTAVLIRTWSTFHYTENDLETIRSLITELSLLSGGEYQVFLLVNIKNKTLELGSTGQRQSLLDQYVPQEFHDISILWNEMRMQKRYPDIGDWQVYWHQFMPLQWFSDMFPQFDFIWNWEMDARYTGNHYHFLEQISTFAKRAPRKYLWERNQRMYFPAAHGKYAQWLADTDASIEAAVKSGSLKTVWGAQPYNETVQRPIGPAPPRAEKNDKFEWGTDEDADLLTLQPIWDPSNTDWSFKDKIFNFLPGVRPHFTDDDPVDRHFTHPEFANVPRRTYINTVSRFSRTLLHAMHSENSAGRTMQAEMWPATVALHHGLKAVYAPHPIWTDRKWPAWYMDAIFNSNANGSAKWSAGQDSVYNHDREHNFAGWSWYYNAEFPRILYRRWLGFWAQVGPEERFPDNPLRALGGREFETKGVKIVVPESSNHDWGIQLGEDRTVRIGGQGRMCLPPMLLHPVKRTSEPEDYLQSLGLDVDDDDAWSRAWKWFMDKFDAYN